MNRLLWMTAACLFAAPHIHASPMDVSGFGIFVYERPKTGLFIQHVWVVGSRELIPGRLKFVGVAALQGPPRIVHDLRLHLMKPVPYVKQVVVGRFIPPFAREWADVRVDNLPLIGYSGVVDSVVARDDGIRADIAWRSVELTAAAFVAKSRIGGFVAERDKGRGHIYQRLRFHLTKALSAGGSYRYGYSTDRDMWALEAAYGDSIKTLAFEVVGYNGALSWHGQGEMQACRWLRLVLRYEDLEYLKRWTGGFIIYLPAKNEIRFNFSDDERRSLRAQFVVRW